MRKGASRTAFQMSIWWLHHLAVSRYGEYKIWPLPRHWANCWGKPLTAAQSAGVLCAFRSSGRPCCATACVLYDSLPQSELHFLGTWIPYGTFWNRRLREVSSGAIKHWNGRQLVLQSYTSRIAHFWLVIPCRGNSIVLFSWFRTDIFATVVTGQWAVEPSDCGLPDCSRNTVLHQISHTQRIRQRERYAQPTALDLAPTYVAYAAPDQFSRTTYLLCLGGGVWQTVLVQSLRFSLLSLCQVH